MGRAAPQARPHQPGLRELRRLAILLLFGLPAQAWAQDAGWVADAVSGCRLWNDAPQIGAEVQWSGACVNGLADGPGIVTTSNGNRYVGSFHAGLRAGHGVLTWLNGNRFEGEFLANKPNGPGTYVQAGRSFSGTWKNGCFEQGGRRAVVGSTARDCGF